MMKSILVILAIGLLQCKSKNISQERDTCCISLEFDGGVGEFYRKYDIYLEIEDAKSNKLILQYLNSLEEIGYVNTRLVMWKIKIYDSEGDRLCDLLKLESGEYVFKRNGDLYKSDDFYDHLVNKVQVQKIGAFPGPVTQEIYDDLIK